MVKLYHTAKNKKEASLDGDCLLLFHSVEPKGFEPLSSCVINYAFYMLIFQSIVGIRRAGNRPYLSP